jgi:hypothetical protein
VCINAAAAATSVDRRHSYCFWFYTPRRVDRYVPPDGDPFDGVGWFSSDLLGKFEGAGLGEYLCYEQASEETKQQLDTPSKRGEGANRMWVVGEEGGYSIGWRGTLLTGSFEAIAGLR